MSRVGSEPVTIPDGAEVKVDGQTVTAKGKLGQSSISIPSEVEVAQEGNVVTFKPRVDNGRSRAMWGTSRSLVNNLVLGVTQGFNKTLDITGVGYRAAVQGKNLNLQLGYSHDINFPIPEGIDIKCEGNNRVIVSGFDKQRVGQVSAVIRQFRKPEPYKGKGIRYSDEQIIRKEGKKK